LDPPRRFLRLPLQHARRNGMRQAMSTTNDVAGTTTGAPQSRGLLGGAVALGAANSLWALFQWAELLLARQGGTPFCSINATFNCAQVWDSALAVAVHDVTRIPVAGWGLVWGIVATLVPLAALVDGGALARGGSSALRFTTLAGLASIAALGAASLAAGALCLGCLGTYALVIGWSVCAWRATRGVGMREPGRGAVGAGAVAAVCALGLLYPGLKTPHATSKLELPVAKAETATPPQPTTPTGATAPPTGPGPFNGPGTGDPVRDDLLQRFMATIDPPTKQAMSDLLAAYRDAKPAVLGQPRSLAFGDGNATVRVTEWTDPQCPHCAMLHEVLGEIKKSVPPGLLSVEARHFPLDGFCNPGVQRKSEDGARCIGALASICFEGDPRGFEATGALFAARTQTADAVYEAFKPFRDVAKLKACVGSDETRKKLQDDIAAAMQFDIQGTPLVLVNGREVQPVPPLLYALVLTGGAWQHPAFADLPPPRPAGQGHDSHAGHAH
jgi:serine/threonine-protein kinase